MLRLSAGSLTSCALADFRATRSPGLVGFVTQCCAQVPHCELVALLQVVVEVAAVGKRRVEFFLCVLSPPID